MIARGGRLFPVVLFFSAVTIANAAVYVVRMRQLNSVPLPSGMDVAVGLELVRHLQTTFWITEGVAFLLCLAALLLFGDRRT